MTKLAAPQFWAQTRARLDPAELAAEAGWITFLDETGRPAMDGDRDGDEHHGLPVRGTEDAPIPGMSTEKHNTPSEPWAIAHDPDLAVQAKIRKLRQLELDARQALVAAEEGMVGSSAPRLQEIRAALTSLRAEQSPLNGPTKL